MQLEHLTYFRQYVEAELTGHELTSAQKQAVRTKIEASYPGYLPVTEIPDYLENNAAAVAAEMTLERTR